MNRGTRKAITFRLTDECRRLLVQLAQYRGVSQAAILEMLVRDEARRLDLEAESKIAA
jgi:hypothetical protein